MLRFQTIALANFFDGDFICHRGIGSIRIGRSFDVIALGALSSRISGPGATITLVRSWPSAARAVARSTRSSSASTPAAALVGCHGPNRVRKQRNLASVLYRNGDLVLVLHAGPCVRPGLDLPSVAHEATEECRILVVHVVDPLGADQAYLRPSPAKPPSRVCGLGPRAFVPVVRHGSLSRCRSWWRGDSDGTGPAVNPVSLPV
jgi:hypothetical protein